MMWVAWRRLRSTLLACLAVASGLIAYAVLHGRSVQRLADAYYGNPCHMGGWGSSVAAFCSKVQADYSNQAMPARYFVLIVAIIALTLASSIGSLAVAGEFDRGTVKWAWTQSRSRRQWWNATTVTALLATLIIIVPLDLTMSWWVGATRFEQGFGPLPFLMGGWMLIAISLLATFLTMTLGLVIRRPGWLVALGVVLAFAGYFPIQRDLPSHLVPAQTAHMNLYVKNQAGGPVLLQSGIPSKDLQQSLSLFQGYRPKGSKVIPSNAQAAHYALRENECVSTAVKKLPAGSGQNETPAQAVAIEIGCQHQLGLEMVTIYIPSREFWVLQLYEGLLIFLMTGFVWLLGWWFVRRTGP